MADSRLSIKVVTKSDPLTVLRLRTVGTIVRMPLTSLVATATLDLTNSDVVSFTRCVLICAHTTELVQQMFTSADSTALVRILMFALIKAILAAVIMTASCMVIDVKVMMKRPRMRAMLPLALVVPSIIIKS